ncbi:MAG: molybdenum cofactor guanylyltransferase [Chloroflexota bacterium]|jgi:molybdopterin-guanine dinucleotide biosynthesis protein A|nr:molybdenum cofactor guanylyltransferase [Chloroflexota bacterium]
MTPCSVLVLAGGRSRRFGRDKLDADWRGGTLRDHVVGRVAELSDDLVVLTAHGSTEPDEPRRGVRVLADSADWPGPLIAVEAGLRVARHDLALIVAADMPVVPMRILELLLVELQEEGRAMVGLTVEGRIEPLPVAVRRDVVLAALADLVKSGARRLGAVRDLPGAFGIAEADWRLLDVKGDSLRDIDTEDDLQSLLAQPAED